MAKRVRVKRYYVTNLSPVDTEMNIILSHKILLLA